MQYPKTCLSIALFASILLAENVARADMIHFAWQTGFPQTSISPDQPTQGAQIYFSSGAGTDSINFDPNRLQYALAIANQGPPFLTEAATYTNKPFVMTLKLTDGPSGLSRTLTFHGIVNGSIGSNPLSIVGGPFAPFSFTDGVQTATIGQDVYHIAMQNGTISGWTDPLPNIFAQINATPDASTPEPSSLLLTAMGLTWLGFTRWKKPVARMSKS